MELVSGKMPTYELFGAEMDMVRWVEMYMAYGFAHKELIDPPWFCDDKRMFVTRKDGSIAIEFCFKKKTLTLSKTVVSQNHLRNCQQKEIQTLSKMVFYGDCLRKGCFHFPKKITNSKTVLGLNRLRNSKTVFL